MPTLSNHKYFGNDGWEDSPEVLEVPILRQSMNNAYWSGAPDSMISERHEVIASNRYAALVKYHKYNGATKEKRCKIVIEVASTNKGFRAVKKVASEIINRLYNKGLKNSEIINQILEDGNLLFEKIGD